MLISEVPFIPDRMFGKIGGLFFDKREHRTKGVHLYEILEDFETRLLGPHKGMSEHELMSYREMGFVWEVVVERVLAYRRMEGKERISVVKQQEFILDGIMMTPDGIDFTAPETRLQMPQEYTWPDDLGQPTRMVSGQILEEYKFTYKTAKDSLLHKKYIRWRMQQMAYLKAIGSCHVRLIVMYANGMWRPPQPTPKEFRIEYHPQEIDSNWATILAHKDLMTREGKLR